MHLYPLAGLQKGLSDPTLLGVLCPHSLTVSLDVQASCDDCTYSFCASSLSRGPPRAAGHSRATLYIATSCSSWCLTRSFSTRYRGAAGLAESCAVLKASFGAHQAGTSLQRDGEEGCGDACLVLAFLWGSHSSCGPANPPIPGACPAQPSLLQDTSPSFCILAGWQHRLGRGAEQARQHRAVPARHAEGSLRLPPGHGVSISHLGSQHAASGGKGVRGPSALPGDMGLVLLLCPPQH